MPAVERQEISRIQLRGVPQIPEAAHRLFTAGGDWSLPASLERECNLSIAEARLEIRRRHEARRQRVSLDGYPARAEEPATQGSRGAEACPPRLSWLEAMPCEEDLQ